MESLICNVQNNHRISFALQIATQDIEKLCNWLYVNVLCSHPYRLYILDHALQVFNILTNLGFLAGADEFNQKSICTWILRMTMVTLYVCNI